MERFIVMYHGVVMEGRGIESLIKLLDLNPNVLGVILGNGLNKYVSYLKKLGKEQIESGRLMFYPAVAQKELWKYVGAVDVGLIMAPAACKNALYSLPNKFFENIQAETPVVCPNYPAMQYLVDKYHIGLTCNPESVEEINSCVERLRTDKELYKKLKENTRKAKEELCWERELIVLKNAFQNVVLTGNAL